MLREGDPTVHFLADGPRVLRPVFEHCDRCRDGQGIGRRDEGWEALEPISGPDPASGVAKSPGVFALELGLENDTAAAGLFAACGGHLELGQVAVAAVAGNAAWSSANMLEEADSTSFADYVASRVPQIDLGVTESDERLAAVLSYLSVFTRQTALMVVSMVGPQVDDDLGSREPEGVLMRLRLAGMLVLVQAEGERRTYRIPSLIAGYLRLRTTSGSASSTLPTALVAALADHLETSQVIDAHILEDALTLARKFEHWQALSRIQESVGLPMFLIAPRAACTAFGHLPAQALMTTPELGFFANLTDDVLDRLANGSSGEDIRVVMARETRAGRMRAFFPSFHDRERSGNFRLPTPHRDHVFGAEGASVVPMFDASAAERDDPLMSSGRADFISTLSRIIALTREDRHEEASAIGLAWSSKKHGRWAQLVVRLLTAIGFFHCSQFRRSVSILSEIEADAVSGHIHGDFLRPAVTAWTALASVVSGDHERADRALSGLDEELQGPILVEELVRPAAHVASALRALDRLDFELAEQELTSLSFYPESRSLWAYLPVIGRTIAILTASTESSLLFTNDDVEKFRDPLAMSVTGRDLLEASRSMVFISLGQLKWAEVEIEQMSQDSDARIVLKARVELIAGRLDSAISLAETWFYHSSLAPARRAELAAVKAAALLRSGRSSEAAAEFVTAVGLSTWVSSLLPIAMLPQTDRNHLLDLTIDDEIWVDAFTAFSGRFRDVDEFFRTLRSVGSVAVDSVAMPQLSTGEAQLLDLLAQGRSISEISTELHQVTGTVKNRLSALYRKFGVSSRGQVLARARSLGFLLP